jgi:hypothetical protein
MADNVAINAGVGTPIATDERNSAHEQLVITTKSLIRVSVTPTVTALGAYTAVDAVGGLMTIPNAARYTGGAGSLVNLTVLDKDSESAALVVFFFDRTVTAPGDNNAFVMTDADLAFFLGAWSSGTFFDRAANSNAHFTHTGPGTSMPFVLSGTDLFALAYTTGTPTYTATTDLTFQFTIEQY